MLVDSNAFTDPLSERAEREDTRSPTCCSPTTTGIMSSTSSARRALLGPGARHELTAEQLEGKVDETFTDGDATETDNLRIKVIDTPGHCADHCALDFNGTDCLTADVLFKGTVGGTRAPGATGFEDLKTSIMDKLMTLSPGHESIRGTASPPPSALNGNKPFARIWRGLDPEGSSPCSSARPMLRSARRQR